MMYCKKCVLPDTRPGLTIDTYGICSACRGHEYKKNIDWAVRKRCFEAIVIKGFSLGLIIKPLLVLLLFLVVAITLVFIVFKRDIE